MWADSSISVMCHIKVNRTFTINTIPLREGAGGLVWARQGQWLSAYYPASPDTYKYTLCSSAVWGGEGGPIKRTRERSQPVEKGKVKWVEWFQIGKRHIWCSVCLLLILVSSSSSLHLRLLWLEGGVWGQSALVFLNGWQMTEKLEAFRSWQVVVCAHFFPFFCFKCFLSVCFSQAVSAATGARTHIITIIRVQKHVQVFACARRRQIWFCVLRFVAVGGGRRAVFPSANCRDRLWLPVWKQFFKPV